MDLKLGMSGPLVYTVQEQLNDRYPALPPLKLNGKFDKAMQDRVRQFQDDFNLTSTGIVDDITSTVLLKTFFEYEIVPRPPVILQDQNRYHCWASSLSAWTQAKPGVKIISVWEAVDEFKKAGVLDPDNEGLPLEGWDQVRKRYHLGFASYGGTKGFDTDLLTIDSIYRMLKKKGPLLIAFNLPETGGRIAHTVVAYGVYIRLNAGSAEKEGYGVWVMDPWNGEGAGGRRVRRLAGLRTSGEVLVMWRI